MGKQQAKPRELYVTVHQSMLAANEHQTLTLLNRRMEDTKFSDLVVRVGAPYFYVHQGNCEHLIVVSDVR